MELKEQKTKQIYIRIIGENFDVTPEQKRVLANRLFDQIIAHGGNPHNLDEIENTIKVIVGSWIGKTDEV
jgi:hypothetical protein